MTERAVVDGGAGAWLRATDRVLAGLNHALTIAYANYCGSEGDLTYVGGSLIADPYGEPLVQAGTAPALLVADLPMVLDPSRLSTQGTDYRNV